MRDINFMTVVERTDTNTIDRQFFSSKGEALEWVHILSKDSAWSEVYEINLVQVEGAREVFE